MLRSRSNCTLIAVAPSELVDVICETPGICAIWRSSGWATDEAIVSGEAPGKLRADRDGREVDLRQRRDRQQRIGDRAGQQDRHHDQRRGDGMSDERSGNAATHRLSSPSWRSRRSTTRRARLEHIGARGHHAVALVHAFVDRPRDSTSWCETRHRAHRRAILIVDDIDEQAVAARAERRRSARRSRSSRRRPCSRVATARPGQRALSLFSNSALSRIEPVATST